MAGYDNHRLESGNLVERLHPVFPPFVLRDAEIHAIENGISRDDGLERRNVDVAVAGTVALQAAGDWKILTLQGQDGSLQGFGHDRVGTRNEIAIRREPEFLARGPGSPDAVGCGRKRDDPRGRKS